MLDRPLTRHPAGQATSASGGNPVELRCPVAFNSASLTLPREYMNDLFAGFRSGPDEPHRLDYSQTFDFPATPADTTVRGGHGLLAGKKTCPDSFMVSMPSIVDWLR